MKNDLLFVFAGGISVFTCWFLVNYPTSFTDLHVQHLLSGGLKARVESVDKTRVSYSCDGLVFLDFTVFLLAFQLLSLCFFRVQHTIIFIGFHETGF